MNQANKNKTGKFDFIFILGIAFFFFSCVASTLHTAKTMEPGQGSFSTGYMQARSSEEFAAEPVQLIGLNGRMGVARGFDLGTEYTLDISKENENTFATIWGDGKVQLTNRDNQLLKPIISTGLLKGYVYNEEIHISSLPVIFSLPISDKLTCTINYRYELLSEGIIPTSLENPRHTFSVGMEYGLRKQNQEEWIPKLAFSLGTLNSLTGEPDTDNVFIFNLGLKINSPYK